VSAFCRLISLMIVIFYFFNISNTAISEYSNMILMISLLMFFFNKKIMCMSSVLAFIANTLNSIIKLVIFLLLLEYLNLLLDIYCLALITEYCFDFFDELVLILGIFFFFHLVYLLLCIYSCDTLSKLGLPYY